ncbi:MAG: DUF1579 domain-containing protein [Dongiaceae bacterium]
MKAEPQKEHHWLQQLAGDWVYEGEAECGPGKPPMNFNGTESVRSLGGVWVVAEGKGEMPDGSPATMIMTLGYDPVKQQYIGTWVGSMMTHLWKYAGFMDKAGKILTLEAEGPNFGADEKKLVPYRDVIEIISADHRTLRSQTKNEDGSWHEFMVAHYRRKK